MFEGLTPEQIALIAASLGMPKLLIKLLDVIQQGTGTISEPYFTRKKAEALADGKIYEIKKLTEQFTESQNLLPSIKYKDGQLSIPSKSKKESNLQQRYEHRFEYQQTRKQLNVENVTANAVEELLSDPEVENYTNNEPVDADWTTRFFETVENVSDEDMQLLWGRILAGEVKKPKSFSLKTLEILRNVSKEEAELFIQFCDYAIETIDANTLFIPKINGFNTLSNRFSDIKYDKYLTLCEVGLINNDDTTQINYGMRKKDGDLIFRLANKIILIKFLEDVSNGNFPIIKFTKSGFELFRLLIPNFNIHLIDYLATGFDNKKVEVFVGEIVGIKDGKLTCDQLNKIK